MPIPYVGRIPITPGIIRAIVSIAETKDDDLKPICLETLVELLVLDVDLLVEADAIDIIFESLAEELVLGRRTAVDEPQSFAMDELDEQPIVLAPIITELLPYFLDFPQYRAHIRTGQHLEVRNISWLNLNAQATAELYTISLFVLGHTYKLYRG